MARTGLDGNGGYWKGSMGLALLGREWQRMAGQFRIGKVWNIWLRIAAARQFRTGSLRGVADR